MILIDKIAKIVFQLLVVRQFKKISGSFFVIILERF